jgi:hypothetical protein
MEDIDEPGGTKVHWLVYGLGPDKSGLDTGMQRGLSLPNGARQGRNDFGERGYHGPNPPEGMSRRYRFTLIALRDKLVLRAGAGKRAFRNAVNRAGGGVETELIGWYKLADEFGPGIMSQPSVLEAVKMPTSEKLRANLDALRNDKEFRRLTNLLERELKEAYTSSPKEVTAFFRRFSFASQFSSGEVDQHLETIPQPDLRELLKRYVEYAVRFRVEFRMETNPLKFRLFLWPDYGEKFHVQIVGDHFEPVTSGPHIEDEPFLDHFESPNLKVLDTIQELIDAGQATFVQIEDESGYSLLKDLENIAYKIEGVTFFLHNTKPPYLGCIFGEKMLKEFLADIGPSITEFQLKYYHRVSSGRPPKPKP